MKKIRISPIHPPLGYLDPFNWYRSLVLPKLVLRAASQGFPKPKDPAKLQGDEVNYEKWNAKARNTIFTGLYKDVFNRMRNHKDAHALCSDICALHEGTKSEHEEHYHLIMKKLNFFEMLPKKSANEIYSRLNVLVEEVNGLDALKCNHPML